MRNEDKRVGKNPAGYLVASIRADYQAPGDFSPRGRGRSPAGPAGRAVRRGAKRREQQHGPAPRRHTSPSREAELRAAWERLPEAERDAILAAVKAENPGLSRWRKMLEPLCLAALDARLNPTRVSPTQPSLFPEI